MKLPLEQRKIMHKLDGDFISLNALAKRLRVETANIRSHVKALHALGHIAYKQPIYKGNTLMVKRALPKETLEFKGILSHQIWI